MTKEAAKASPDLIIWPEAATPRSITVDSNLYAGVKEIAKAVETPLLVGSTHLHKIRGKGDQGVKYRNSAFLIEPEGEGESRRYDKMILLPFAEYTPGKEAIPWSYVGVPDLGNYIPGKEFTVFDGPGFHFSVAVCWESLFPNLIREFVRAGAQVVINITNEGWFGETAPYQFLACNVFRAVENRVYLVRCANTGITCFIDPYGRITDRVKDIEGRDIHVRGVLTGTVVPLESKTFYTRFGDWLVWLSFAVSGALVLLAIFQKRPNREKTP
jgi:apolipoprotein N-acyltransferase